jgi:hypothetical protein
MSVTKINIVHKWFINVAKLKNNNKSMEVISMTALRADETYEMHATV